MQQDISGQIALLRKSYNFKPVTPKRQKPLPLQQQSPHRSTPAAENSSNFNDCKA